MPSFASLLTYAALGFAAFASVAAVPVTVADNHLSLVEVEARGCDCKSLPTIIVDLTADLNACLAPIVFGTSANITVEVVTPIIVEAKALVVAAIADVKVLVGLNVEVILATATGVISLIDISGLLCTLLALVFSVVNIVLTILVKVDVDIISPLLCELLVVVAELLQLVLSLVGGLLAILLPLIFNIILPVILKLNLVSVFAFLGVSIQL